MLFTLLVGLLALSHANADLKAVIMGDWGVDNEDQYIMAERMGLWVEEHGADFIIVTGDNFYNRGVESSDDERFERTWREVYTHPALAELPWYISAGNHDHGEDGREWYQVCFGTREPRWVFPELTYGFNAKARESQALFVAIATQSVREDTNNKAYQLKYLNDTLKHSNADWKFVFGHHPSFSCGGQPGSSQVRNEVLPIMLDNEVDFYIAGHDHNLQHWQATAGVDIDHITSGAAGQKLYAFNQEQYEREVARGMSLMNFSMVHGFIYFEVNEIRAKASFVDRDGEIIYVMRRFK